MRMALNIYTTEHITQSFERINDSSLICTPASHSDYDRVSAERPTRSADTDSMTSDHDCSFIIEDEWQDTLNIHAATSIPPLTPKLGGRFSRNVIRILNNWLVQHKQNPYPNDDDIGVLQTQTGLNKKQVTNWFTNTRRRSRMQCVRPASPQVRVSPTDPIDILPRPGTPALRQRTKFKGPLQRWVDSPPEDEGAAMGDIACAVASRSGATSCMFSTSLHARVMFRSSLTLV
jgi:hypothetical protein